MKSVLAIWGEEDEVTALADWLKENKKVIITGVIAGGIFASVTAVTVATIRIIADMNKKKALEKIKKTYDATIIKHAGRGTLRPIIASVIAIESDGVYNVGRAEPTGRRCKGTACAIRPGEYGISYGLMQIIPYVIKGGVKVIWNYSGNANDLWNTDTNIRVGTSKLKGLYNKYNSWPLAVAAYNAGAGNVNKAVAKYGKDWQAMIEKKALPSVTRKYLKRMFGRGGVLDTAKRIFV
jgi:preprotein translocase subunit YajC